MENMFLRIAGDVVLLTLVVATIIEGIGYVKFLWIRMMKGEGTNREGAK